MVAHAGVIRVCLTNLSASATTTAAGQKATAGQNIPSLASAVQTMLTPVGTIDPATGSVALTGANPAGQDAAATVAKVAAQAQAIQAQSQANASAPDLAAQTGSTSNNAILTPDALAAALVQAEQTAATKVATVVAGKMAAAAKVASPDGKVSSGSAALPANPLGIVLPPAGSVSRTVAAKAPAATAIAAATSTDSATAKGAKPVEKIAAKSGNARLAAAVAGNSLNHDVALASAQAAQGSASGASVVQTAQAGTAADTLAGANLAMPAALADQIAGQLPLDGTMPGLITIHLNPPELGRLQLTFENDASGGVVAVIRAENPDTLAQLRQEMPSVMEKINETGVNLKRVEVTLSGQQGNATDSAGREGMWQQARQEQPLRWGAYEEDAPAPDTAAVATRNAGWTNGTGLNVWM